MLATGVAVGEIATRYGATVLDQFGQRPIYRLRLASPATLSSTLAAMRADARVQFAEPNFESETPERRRQLVWAIGGWHMARHVMAGMGAIAGGLVFGWLLIRL